jgi:Spy/CpxP family protein refolding chaperone
MKNRVLLLMLLGAALPLVAQPQMPDGKWWKRPRIAERIGLTGEQSDQIEKIFRASRPRLIDLKADLEKKQLGLESALDDRAADRSDVEKRIDDVENARKDLQKERALMILDMKQVLSPEQWKRLAQMREEVRERRRQMRGQDPPPDRRPDGSRND